MRENPSAPVGLIAGNGRFPMLVARAARRGGRRIVAVAVREETSEDITGEVDEVHWMSLGQLGRCIETFKKSGVHEAVMAGQVKHRQLFSGIVPDLKLMRVIAGLALKNTDSLLGGVAEAFEGEGIRLLSSVAFLEDQLARPGAMTRRPPSSEERKDIRYGRQIARSLAGLDLGQSVAVKSQAAVALEAMEGTDEMIRRAGRIAGPGVTVVKVAKPKQDLRFDVPVVGPGTLDAMSEVGARALAIDPHRTLLIDKDEFLALADRRKIAVWGLTEEP
ncbi:MAG: UDP-2,3-diacylglucosamine diphosphatase LpxI [Vicinamibacteria bacterium]|nr:UDP-2,3-diacylglucosamine diphosphatase LpxI [Vicinamibacteria bacterium]